MMHTWGSWNEKSSFSRAKSLVGTAENSLLTQESGKTLTSDSIGFEKDGKSLFLDGSYFFCPNLGMTRVDESKLQLLMTKGSLLYPRLGIPMAKRASTRNQKSIPCSLGRLDTVCGCETAFSTSSSKGNSTCSFAFEKQIGYFSQQATLFVAWTESPLNRKRMSTQDTAPTYILDDSNRTALPYQEKRNSQEEITRNHKDPRPRLQIDSHKCWL